MQGYNLRRYYDKQPDITKEKMEVNKSIFRENDIRGTYPEQLNEFTIGEIGKAIAIKCKKENIDSISVGRDGRLSGESLLDAFCESLVNSGMNVTNIGMVTSPMLYFEAKINDTKSGIIITGSHNPKNHNGLKMVAQFFSSRGFAVLDVNYGGSSGYGREYRQRLNRNWGIVDVNDCSKAALYVAEQGWVDKDRLAIRGGSAGGFTTLAALAFTDVFKAGASHYGVSDLEALAKETHKFESRYLDTLIGSYPEEKELYKKRSPVNAVERLSCPVIFFQGLEDKIVLPNQAEMMVDALREKGIPVAYIAYEGEQHGFRQAKNIKRTLESELYFYSTIFNFECADKVEPVEFL